MSRYYLKIAVLHFAIACIGIWLMGCAAPVSYQPVCKQTALFCAQAVRDLTGQPTRLVLYTRAGRLAHVQSETFRAGVWRPLYVPTPVIYEGPVDIAGADIDSYCDPDFFHKVYFDWTYQLGNKETQ